MPKVSTVIPAYNSAKYVCQAVESVLAQIYQDYEVIVVDDGSTDDTRQRLMAYEGRIRYICQDNAERSAARNNGIRQSTGEYIAFLDADDLWLPRKLQAQVAFLERNPDVGLVYSYARVIDADGKNKPFLKGDFPEQGVSTAHVFHHLMLGNFIPCPTVVVRRACLDVVGLFDESFCYVEDWELWLRVALRYPVGFISEPLACHRVYGEFWPAKLDKYHVQDATVRVLEKIFALAPELAGMADLKQRSLGQAYWLGARIDYALDRLFEARQRLEQAVVYDPTLVSNTQRFLESVLTFAEKLYDTQDTPLAEAQTYLGRVFSNLPASLPHLRGLKRKALGALCASRVYSGHVLQNRAAVRSSAWRAALYDPSWLINLGFLSLWTESLIGPMPASLLRKLIRREIRRQRCLS